MQALVHQNISNADVLTEYSQARRPETQILAGALYRSSQPMLSEVQVLTDNILSVAPTAPTEVGQLQSVHSVHAEQSRHRYLQSSTDPKGQYVLSVKL